MVHQSPGGKHYQEGRTNLGRKLWLLGFRYQIALYNRLLWVQCAVSRALTALGALMSPLTMQAILTNSPVQTLQALCAAIFALWHLAPEGFMQRHFVLSRFNVSAGRLWTVITANVAPTFSSCTSCSLMSQISHYDLPHLVGNMSSLVYIGPALEQVHSFSVFMLR